MNENRFGQIAWAYACQIAFPRLVGRSGERKAATLIEGWLTDLGYQVESQRFPIHAMPWAWMRAGLVLSFILLISAGFSGPQFPLLAVFCCTSMVAALPVMDVLWRRRNRPNETLATAEIQSANILARHSASSSNPALTICLMAHYDSKSQSLSIRTRIILIIILLAGTFVFGLANLIVGVYPEAVYWTATPAMTWMASALWFGSLVAILCLLSMRTENDSPGGLDNAGSVGVLMAVAEALKARSFRSIDVTFALTGAEEQGLLGAQALAARWSKKLDPTRTWILNLDGVGVSGALRLIEGARMLRSPSSPFARMMYQAAEKRSVGLAPLRLWPGFLLDHIPFSRKGFQATSLVTASAHSKHIHTPNDTIDLIDADGLLEAGQLVESMLTVLDENPEISNGQIANDQMGKLQIDK